MLLQLMDSLSTALRLPLLVGAAFIWLVVAGKGAPGCCCGFSISIAPWGRACADGSSPSCPAAPGIPGGTQVFVVAGSGLSKGVALAKKEGGGEEVWLGWAGPLPDSFLLFIWGNIPPGNLKCPNFKLFLTSRDSSTCCFFFLKQHVLMPRGFPRGLPALT